MIQVSSDCAAILFNPLRLISPGFFFLLFFSLLFWFPGTLVSRSLKDLLHRRKTFVVPRNLAKILNEAAEKSHGDQVTLKDIPSKYPCQFLPATGTTSITAFAHCELILALHVRILRSVYPGGFASRARNLWKILKSQVQYEFLYLKIKVRFMPAGGCQYAAVSWKKWNMSARIIARRRGDSFPRLFCRLFYI